MASDRVAGRRNRADQILVFDRATILRSSVQELLLSSSSTSAGSRSLIRDEVDGGESSHSTFFLKNFAATILVFKEK